MNRLSFYQLYILLFAALLFPKLLSAQDSLSSRATKPRVRQQQNPPIDGDRVESSTTPSNAYTTGKGYSKNNSDQSADNYYNPNGIKQGLQNKETVIKGLYTALPNKSYTFIPNGSTNLATGNNRMLVGYDKTGLVPNQPTDNQQPTKTSTYNFSGHLSDPSYLSTYTIGPTSYSSYTVGSPSNYRSQFLHGRIIAKPNASYTFSPVETSTDSTLLDNTATKKVEEEIELPKGYTLGPANQNKEQAKNGVPPAQQEESNHKFPTNYALGRPSQYRAQNIKGELVAMANNPISVTPVLATDEKHNDNPNDNNKGKFNFNWEVSEHPANNYQQRGDANKEGTLSQKIEEKNKQKSTVPIQDKQTLSTQSKGNKLGDKETQSSMIAYQNDFNKFRYKFSFLRNNGYYVSISEKNFILNISSSGKLIDYAVYPNTHVSISKNYLGLLESIDNCPIIFSYNGKVQQIGETKVTYENSGLIKKIGNVVIDYNLNQSINSIGSNKVGYDENGKPQNENIVVY